MARRRRLIVLTVLAVAVAGCRTAHSAGVADPGALSASRASSAPRGGHVSGAAETILLRRTMAGRASAGCPRPHRQFAVLQAQAYVEIGGCHRVLRPGNGIGQASPAALAVISRVGRG